MPSVDQRDEMSARVRSLRVLVVVPTLNEAGHIEALLTQLVAEEPAFVGFRLVVVDGGSSDGTAERVRALSVRHECVTLLHNSARIQSSALNLAARARGPDSDVLIRCDAHAVYPPDYCQRLCRTLLQTGADAVVVPLDSRGQSAVQRAVAWTSNSKIGTGGSAHRAGNASGFVDHGHHAAFRMDSFRESGGYDESFTHNEDAELDCRQRALGRRIYLDCSIRVTYHPRSSFGALARQYYRYGLGRSRTARRHPGSLRLRQLAVPLHFVLLLTLLALAPMWRAPLLYPALYAAALIGVALRTALRERSPAGLLVAPAALVMHAAWAAGFLVGLATTREPVWRAQAAHPLWVGTSSSDAAVARG